MNQIYNQSSSIQYAVLVGVTLTILLTACAGGGAGSSTDMRYVYLVRHAEVDKDNPDKPLNAEGRARASKLVQHFNGAQVTHIFATHTDRTRDTVLELAKARRLAVEQFPNPGSELDSKVVDNRTASKVAIKPMITAINRVPAGSTVVVSANSENLYGIMAGLGVRVDEACTVASDNCIPCAEKTCFPEKQFDNVWALAVNSKGVAKMTRATYGN